VQYGEPGSLTSSLSPLVQVGAQPGRTKDVTFDKPFTVKGSGQYVEKGSEIGHPAHGARPGHDPQPDRAEELLR
jgi:hypothetical protein